MRGRSTQSSTGIRTHAHAAPLAEREKKQADQRVRGHWSSRSKSLKLNVRYFGAYRNKDGMLA